MNPLTALLRLPLLPLKSVVGLAQLIQTRAEQELRDPARVRREIEEAEYQRAMGKISAEELSQIQENATGSLIAGRSPGRRRGSR